MNVFPLFSASSREKRAEDWEKTCSRCGLCCHEKQVVGTDVIFDLDSWCEHYDPRTKTCRIYARRLTEQVRCSRVTRWKAMTSRLLPDECAYVKWAVSKHIRFAPYRRIRYIRESDDDIHD
jgi:hypothetical protein